MNRRWPVARRKVWPNRRVQHRLIGMMEPAIGDDQRANMAVAINRMPPAASLARKWRSAERASPRVFVSATLLLYEFLVRRGKANRRG